MASIVSLTNDHNNDQNDKTLSTSKDLGNNPKLPPIPLHPKLHGARDKFREPNGEQMIKFYLAPGTNPEEGIFIMMMNRLQAKNGFSDEMYLVFADVLNHASSNEQVKVVILAGVGEMFSSGADLRAGAKGGESLKSELGMVHDPVGIFMRTLMRFPKLIIAAVQGPSIGVGTTLLAHCDIVYASTEATFWTPFTRIAAVPEFCSSYLFPKIMGLSNANEMLVLSKKMNAQKALSCGFVSEVFPAGPNFLQTVIEEVRKGLVYPFMERSIPLFKTMVRIHDLVVLDQVFVYELEELDKRYNSGEMAEAVIEFLQKERTKKKNSKL